MGFIDPELNTLSLEAKGCGFKIVKEELSFGTFYDVLKKGKIVAMARSEKELEIVLEELISGEKDSLF